MRRGLGIGWVISFFSFLFDFACGVVCLPFRFVVFFFLFSFQCVLDCCMFGCKGRVVGSIHRVWKFGKHTGKKDSTSFLTCLDLIAALS